MSAALLIACLAVARSPSSAIAIIEELHAKGPFTTTVLTVTVLMDVVVVLLFALTQLVVSSLQEGGAGEGGAEGGGSLLLEFVQQTLLSVVLGCLIGFSMPLIYACPIPEPDRREKGWRGALASSLCAWSQPASRAPPTFSQARWPPFSAPPSGCSSRWRNGQPSSSPGSPSSSTSGTRR